MRLQKYKCCCGIGILVVIYFSFGISDYLYARSFEQNFDYPLNIDIKPLIQQLMDDSRPEISPINYYPYKYLSPHPGTCLSDDKLPLVILVKSALNNFDHRAVIRETWGGYDNLPIKFIKVLFFLGISETPKSDVQDMVDKEISQFADIIQCDFIDTYFNNTIKTMMAFRWIYEYCPNSEYYFFTDDDMYISVFNLLQYLKDPFNYPKEDKKQLSNERNLKDLDIFAGYVFKSAPHRHITSKWRVTLDEYPWDMWPPYVTAGAYIVNNSVMKKLYLGSLYVKHFRFDDIYLGIVAKKAGITPLHCSEIYFYKKPYRDDNYKYMIASHGYSNHKELVDVWNAQRIKGYA